MFSRSFLITRSDVISAERLIYHVLLTLKTSFGQPWELVCDLTQTSLVNQIKVSEVRNEDMQFIHN